MSMSSYFFTLVEPSLWVSILLLKYINLWSCLPKSLVNFGLSVCYRQVEFCYGHLEKGV